MISKRNDEFEIRKLSNTFNANVIFSIEINPQSGINFISDEDFVNHL